MILEKERIAWGKVVERITEFIRDIVEKSKAEGVVVGVSGGVDSATTAFLCVKALGKDRVLGLVMPEKGVTKEEDIKDAIEICKSLGIEYRLIYINPMVNSFLENLEKNGKIAVANIKPRIRMIISYYYANKLNYLVAGTGNKSELMTGYFCYDKQSKAVTEDGLKPYYKLRPGDTVYSLNLNNLRIEKVPVKAVYKFNYSGKMVEINNGDISLLVTLNHRMVVRSSEREFLSFTRAANLFNSFSVKIPKLLSEKNQTELSKLEFSEVKPKNIEIVEYDGVIWCPDVPPNHNLLIERDGSLVFSGNTKYGDGGVDFLPIGDLYKTEVLELARFLGVPEKIIRKKPSAGLWVGQTDEDELGISYAKLDAILKSLEKGLKEKEITETLKIEEAEIKKVKEMVEKSRHKRETPPVASVRELLS